jgi:hypothetical protein
MSQVERRCPRCGALASSDATWCGQCFASLEEPSAGPRRRAVAWEATEAPPQAPREMPGRRPEPTWTCPICETANPIDLDVCAVCGTTFASMMRQDEAPPKVAPREAFIRSLAFPGLGHRAVGRGGDGLARAVLFLMTFAIALVAILSGPTAPAVATVALLFGAMAIATYLGSAVEAARMARGGPALLSARAILWILVGIVMGSVLILSVLVVSAQPTGSP